MHMKRFLWATAVAAALLPALAHAQVTPTVKQAATREVEFPGYTQGGAVQLYDISGNALGTSSHPVLIACPDGTTNCFSGGGGGSVTQGTVPWVVSGATGVALALESDTGSPGATVCATDTGSCSLNALLQRLAQRLTTLNSTLNAPFQASGSIGNTSFVSQFSTNNANATPHLCGSTSTYKHITSGTDTQLLAASGSTTIYICDIRFSASAALNFYLEKSSSGTCSSPTQIDILVTAAANTAHLPSNAFYQGLNTGGSQQLCINTSAGNLDISVIYDQY